MSISSQPPTRQTGVQRSRSSLLGPAVFDAMLEQKRSDTSTLQPRPQIDLDSLKPCPTSTLSTPHKSREDSITPPAKQSSGLLPALASKIAEQMQTKRDEALTSSTPGCALHQPGTPWSSSLQTAAPAPAQTQHAMSTSLGMSDAYVAAMAKTAQLTAELTAFKAGQGAGLDKVQWAASARQTAFKVCSCLPRAVL